MHPAYAPGTGVFAARPPFALIKALDQAVGMPRPSQSYQPSPELSSSE